MNNAYLFTNKEAAPCRKTGIRLQFFGFYSKSRSGFSTGPKLAPKLKGVHEAMQAIVTAGDMSGAVTVVTTKIRSIHLDAVGLADITQKRPMQANTLFWMASMTKPVRCIYINATG